MRQFLEALSAKFDYLILDSPPVLAVSDATVLSRQVGGVIVLVDTGKTRRKQLKEAVNRLREVRAELVGAILNRVETTSEYYYPYYKKNGKEIPGRVNEAGETSEDKETVNAKGKSTGLFMGLRSRRKK
jgi:Mrp family chromosome partitioning ATPase